MNIYSFNNVIYDGNVMIDLYKFCIKRNISIIKYIPAQIFAAILYIFGAISECDLYERLFPFLTPSVVNDFWNKNSCKITPWYKQHSQSGDAIMSDYPTMLIYPISSKILTTSDITEHTDWYSSDLFYTASISDLKTAQCISRSFFVCGNTVTALSDYRPTVKDKLLNTFLSVRFIKFLIVGAVNTLNSIALSFLFSLKLQPNLAFMSGYITSLAVAYFLNTFFVFKEHPEFIRYVKFCISYIPNFLIQNICVFILFNTLGLPKLISYLAAAVLGIPTTFILLNVVAFHKRQRAK